MPKTFSEFPHTISAAVTPLIKKCLDAEMTRTGRALAPIIREALYEYFDIEEEETIMVRITPKLAKKLQEQGYITPMCPTNVGDA